MTELESPTVLRLGDPADVLSAIPYLLTYRPECSLVFLLLSERRLIVTARIELEIDRAPSVVDLADYLQRVSADHGADGLILVAYHTDIAWASGLLIDLISWLDSVAVHEALVADGQCWWSCLCLHKGRAECGCGDSTGTPYDVSATAVSAQAVVAGLNVQPSREALAESVAGPATDQARQLATMLLEAALAEISELGLVEQKERMALLIDQHCSGRSLTEREYGQLAILAYEPGVRDVAVDRMDRAQAAAHIALWREVVAHTIAPFEVPPLCLLGLAGWLSGDGALQVVCMERAEQIQPDYSLLRVLDQINADALHPGVWDTPPTR